MLKILSDKRIRYQIPFFFSFLGMASLNDTCTCTTFYVIKKIFGTLPNKSFLKVDVNGSFDAININ